MTDANEIIHALRLWFQAGDVFEVRWTRCPPTGCGRTRNPVTLITSIFPTQLPPLGNSVPIAEPMRQSIRSNRSCWPAPGTGFARFSKNRRPPIRKSLPDAGS